MVNYSNNMPSYNSNCITGDKDHLYARLKQAIEKAKKIDIIVAFLIESGVRLLEEDLKQAVGRGAKIRLLCGNYLNITQPQALYLLKDTLGEKVDLRFYNIPNKSFHPKAYIFQYDIDGEIYIGSSNISRSALTSGIEWNYRIDSSNNHDDYEHFVNTFEDLFLNKSIIVDDIELRRYSKQWKRPKVFEVIEEFEDSTHEQLDSDEQLNSDEQLTQDGQHNSEGKFNQSEQLNSEGQLTPLANSTEIKTAAEPDAAFQIDYVNNDSRVIVYPRPMGAQIEALYELKKCRLEGFDKGLIVAATGIGKTYLAAFDSREYNRILFVAHREEILSQAERTFKCVRPERETGFFTGDYKDKHKDIIFATVQTLGRSEYLNDSTFKKDEFDYIIIDEFHHAVADNYMNIINYFKPKFLLGLTATPERFDNQDVFALCDYNTVYEIRLKESINKGLLTPFRYYGVFDDTDYQTIDYKNGKYDEKQLEQALSINKRADLIFKHYQKYDSARALGFCTSRNHAIFMAEYFINMGISACAVISGVSQLSEYSLNRSDAINKLKMGQLKVIFSVDMFNEGLDIPELDMIMFLRPTQSPTIFLQQLGRGLRKYKNKRYVNILDFIGNYKRALDIPRLLTGDVERAEGTHSHKIIPSEESYPDDCIINFDFNLIDLFNKMQEQQATVFDRIRGEYFRIKEQLQRKPMRLDMYKYIDENIFKLIQGRSENNIFKDYIGFLYKINELSDNEKALYSTKAHSFINEIETTLMTKLYKMPILLAFYNRGIPKLNIDKADIYNSFRDFYSHASNAVDMLRNESTKSFKEWGVEQYFNLAKNQPIKAFLNTAKDFFDFNNNVFSLDNTLNEYLQNPAFREHFKDVIEYRTKRFYKERLVRFQDEIYKIV